MSCLSIVRRRHGGTVVLVHFLQSACEQVSGAPEHIQVNVRDDIWLICNLRSAASYVLPAASLCFPTGASLTP